MNLRINPNLEYFKFAILCTKTELNIYETVKEYFEIFRTNFTCEKRIKNS